MLAVANLRIVLGYRVLLNDASFRLMDGEKVALVGPNGAGKTSLLRTLAGELHPAHGAVVRPEHFSWLQQDVQAIAIPKALGDELRADAGSPALKITRRYLDAAAQAFEISVSVHPADRFTFSMQMDRSKD